ncbi:hypothetical protein BLOT_007061 [Blomia tropicalis]|nr:hypothetical protein BLOT_007061 [Blomia tropicalis]
MQPNEIQCHRIRACPMSLVTKITFLFADECAFEWYAYEQISNVNLRYVVHVCIIIIMVSMNQYKNNEHDGNAGVDNNTRLDHDRRMSNQTAKVCSILNMDGKHELLVPTIKDCPDHPPIFFVVIVLLVNNLTLAVITPLKRKEKRGEKNTTRENDEKREPLLVVGICVRQAESGGNALR